MKKYLYLVYLIDGYEAGYPDSDECKAFNSLDDAQSYRDYLKPLIDYGDEVVITKIECR